MTLRPRTCELVQDGVAAPIEPQVFRVLYVLAGEMGALVPRQVLVDRCWGGRIVTDAAINRVISRIRQIGAASGAFELATVRKVGYRLDLATGATVPPPIAAEAPVEAPPAATASPGRRINRPLAATAAAACLLAGIAGAVWVRRAPAPAKHSPPVIYVAPVKPDDPQDRAAAGELTEQFRASLARLQGLRLVESGPAGPPLGVDIELDGELKRKGPDQLVDLVLRDTRTGERIWGAAIDGRTTATPSLQDRAVEAPVRYISIWLGERLAGQPTAREPENPEALRLVQDAQRQLAAATEARQAQDLARAAQLYTAAAHTADQALAVDKHSIDALMIKYRLLSSPEYPRLGEAMAAFHARRQQAAAVLAEAFADDPNAPAVLVASAQQLRESLRWQDAGKLLERAVAIDPNSADANTWYAYHLGLLNQCDQAARHGSLAASLDPSQSWRQLILPRMQLCKGRLADAMTSYRTLLKEDRGNVIILHDAYDALLGARDAAGMRRWAAFARQQWAAEAPPPKVTQMIARMEAAADALSGAPGPFLNMIEAEVAHGPPGPKSGALMFSKGDTNFILALEYGEAGATDRALDRLAAAVGDGSFYLPWALPYGAAEFPAAMRASPRYHAIWRSRPELVALMEARRQAANPAPPRPGGG